MKPSGTTIELISAPSILGLKPSGVEKLADSLMGNNLAWLLGTRLPVLYVPTDNVHYNYRRDQETKCLNPQQILAFSQSLILAVTSVINKDHFPVVLGGDCSILLGVMPALKAKGNYGLIFMDAHADFYEPEKSITGEVADMDLAIVTGRGPEMLTNINGLKPYVNDKHVIHIGQRDWEETKKYGSQDVRKTAIHCHSFTSIEKDGVAATLKTVLEQIGNMNAEGFWMHFDTDVLSDSINPAVDYRLPGGLSFEQVEYLIKNLLRSGRVCGISITIFNPDLDQDRQTSKAITESLGRAFDLTTL